MDQLANNCSQPASKYQLLLKTFFYVHVMLFTVTHVEVVPFQFKPVSKLLL